MKNNDRVPENLACILDAYNFEQPVKECRPIENGHINKTIRICFDGSEPDILLQKINTYVFHKPEELMQNIDRVTSYLKRKSNMPLRVYRTKDDNLFFKDAAGDYWRVYNFISGSFSHNMIDSPQVFNAAGYAFGSFMSQLADFPVEDLYETIPHFHDTPDRFRQLTQAIQEDRAKVRSSIQYEIDEYCARKNDCAVITDRIADGSIPIRVTHNDTKLNNVLFSEQTGEFVCIVDLDTVMPGSALYDFGDAIRFGASTAAEDETDLSKVSIDLDLYKAYTTGYLKAASQSLTPAEIRLLPFSAKLLTLECGMRFLADHLNGDVYFGIQRPGQNLDRARTQLRLVQDMETKMQKMEEITASVCAENNINIDWQDASWTNR